MRSGLALALAVAVVALSFAASGAAIAGDKCALSASASGDKCCANLEAKLKKQGWLGVEKNLNEDGTYTIASVAPGSPAEQAGLRTGDVIEAINGKKLTAENGAKVCHLSADNAKIGQTATYSIRRGGERLTVEAKLARMPETVVAAMMEKHKEEHREAHN